MADKQQLLAEAIPDLVARLTHPHCVDACGRPSRPSRSDACALARRAARREFNPVQDMHIGVITTSVGDGAAASAPSAARNRGRLFAPLAVTTYLGLGFLAFDPNGVNDPPGEADPNPLVARLASWCGSVVAAARSRRRSRACTASSSSPSRAVADGVCEQRRRLRARPPAARSSARAFLRPDSLLAILMLTDENDCSLRPGPATRGVRSSGSCSAPRATSVCQTDPNDPCCHSCGEQAPAGCRRPEVDPDARAGPTRPKRTRRSCAAGIRSAASASISSIRSIATCAACASPIIEDGARPARRRIRSSATCGPRPRRAIRRWSSSAHRRRSVSGVGRPERRGPSCAISTPRSSRRAACGTCLLGDPEHGIAAERSVHDRVGGGTLGHEPDHAACRSCPRPPRKRWPTRSTATRSTCVRSCSNRASPICNTPASSSCRSRRPAAERPNCDCAGAPELARRPICQQPAGGGFSNRQWGGKAYPGLRPLRGGARVRRSRHRGLDLRAQRARPQPLRLRLPPGAARHPRPHAARVAVVRCHATGWPSEGQIRADRCPRIARRPRRSSVRRRCPRLTARFGGVRKRCFDSSPPPRPSMALRVRHVRHPVHATTTSGSEISRSSAKFAVTPRARRQTPRRAVADARHARCESVRCAERRMAWRKERRARHSALQIAPHVAALGRIDVERRVVPALRRGKSARAETASRRRRSLFALAASPRRASRPGTNTCSRTRTRTR